MFDAKLDPILSSICSYIDGEMFTFMLSSYNKLKNSCFSPHYTLLAQNKLCCCSDQQFYDDNNDDDEYVWKLKFFKNNFLFCFHDEFNNTLLKSNLNHPNITSY